MVSPADDMRKMLQTLKESDNSNDLNLDSLLTTPKENNIRNLIQKIKPQSIKTADLDQALNSLEKNDSDLPINQKKLLLDILRTISRNSVQDSSKDAVNETEVEDTDSVDGREFINTFHDISKLSPILKLNITKIAQILQKGISSRPTDGGAYRVISHVSKIIEAARSGSKNQSLQLVQQLVNQFEGDKHAFDQRAFPNLVVALILLIGELSNIK